MPRLTEAESKRREQQVRATYERLAEGASHAITAADLARATGYNLSSVSTILQRSSWWTPALAAAARAEHLHRLHNHLQAQGNPGLAAMHQIYRSKSQARASALFDAYQLLHQQIPVVTPDDLAHALGLDVRSVKARLAQAAWWTSTLAAAAEVDRQRRRRLPPGEQEAEREAVPILPPLPAQSPRPMLRPAQVFEIRQHLAAGELPRTLAQVYGVHKNTILGIQRGRLWAGVTEERARQKREEATIPQVVQIVEADTAAVVLPPALWRALHSPARVQLVRRRRDQALVLLPTTEQGDPLSTGPTLRITLTSEALQRLGLTPGEYRWALPAKNGALRISDFPETAREDLIPIAEACQILGVSRQGVSQLIAAGHFQGYFDAVRGRQVVRRSVVLARKAQPPAARYPGRKHK